MNLGAGRRRGRRRRTAADDLQRGGGRRRCRPTSRSATRSTVGSTRAALVRDRHARHDLSRTRRPRSPTATPRLAPSRRFSKRSRFDSTSDGVPIGRRPVLRFARRLTRASVSATTRTSHEQDRSPGFALVVRARRPRRLGRRRLRRTTSCCAIPVYTSFCDVSATVSCTQVYASRFGTLRGRSGRDLRRDLVRVRGAAVARRPDRAGRPVRESVPGYLFAGSTLGARRRAVSRLRVVRPAEAGLRLLCLITYAAVIGLFLVSGAATSVPMTDVAAPRRSAICKRARREPAGARAGGRCSSAGAASTLAFFPREATPSPAAPASRRRAAAPSRRRPAVGVRAVRTTAQPRVPLVVPAEGAKVLVVKFNDYQCPACGQSYTGLQADPREVRGVAARARCGW